MNSTLLRLAADMLDLAAMVCAYRGSNDYMLPESFTDADREALALLANREKFGARPREGWPHSAIVSAENMRTGCDDFVVMEALAFGLREMAETPPAAEPNRFRKVFPAAVPWRERRNDGAVIGALVRHDATDAEAADVLAADHDRVMRENMRLCQLRAPDMRVVLEDREEIAAEHKRHEAEMTAAQRSRSALQKSMGDTIAAERARADAALAELGETRAKLVTAPGIAATLARAGERERCLAAVESTLGPSARADVEETIREMGKR